MVVQLHLPIRHGGFGLLSAQQLSPSLYLSATVRYRIIGAAAIGVPQSVLDMPLNTEHTINILAVEYPRLRPSIALLTPHTIVRPQVVVKRDPCSAVAKVG